VSKLLALIYRTQLYITLHLDNIMVHVIPSASEELDMLKALLVTQLSTSQLEEFKSAFEDGAKVHLRPMMHLRITQAPHDYTNATLAHMRIMEDQAGNNDPFVVIDEDVVEKGVVWYVADFADENNVENGFAEGEDVLMRALVRTDRLAISHICWQQGNPPMGEELEALDADLSPLGIDSEQSTQWAQMIMTKKMTRCGRPTRSKLSWKLENMKPQQSTQYAVTYHPCLKRQSS
jgi:hypothetical protein